MIRHACWCLLVCSFVSQRLQWQGNEGGSAAGGLSYARLAEVALYERFHSDIIN